MEELQIEKYWGKDLLDRDNFTAQSQWYWASAESHYCGQR
jgi:hypothetical protein